MPVRRSVTTTVSMVLAPVVLSATCSAWAPVSAAMEVMPMPERAVRASVSRVLAECHVCPSVLKVIIVRN